MTSCFENYKQELTKCIGGEEKLERDSSKHMCAGAIPLALPFGTVKQWKFPQGCRRSGNLLRYTAECCGVQIHGTHHAGKVLSDCLEDPKCGFDITIAGWLFIVGMSIIWILGCTGFCWWLRRRRSQALLEDEEMGVELPIVEGGPKKSWLRRSMPHWGIKKSLVYKRGSGGQRTLNIPVPAEVYESATLAFDEANKNTGPEPPQESVQESSAPAEEPPEPEPPEEEEEKEPEEEVIYARSLEEEVTLWLERLSDEPRDGQPFGEWLKDGQILCKVANAVQPGIIKKINTQKMPFKKMENITNFIGVCRKLGVLEKDLFSTTDLYEEKNLKSVQNCIYNLASIIRTTAPDFKGPYLGVRQKAQVKDKLRKKQTHADLSIGLRKDVSDEVRDANKSAAGVRVAGEPG